MRTGLLTLFLLCSLQILAQNRGYFYGKVTDANSGAEIPFASIKIKNKPIGLISNADGGFKIPKYFKKAADTLVVSFIGYYEKQILVSQMNPDEINVIKMTEKIQNLDEIVLSSNKRKLRAKQIIRLAMRNIKENYPFNPFSYVGYYRDYQMKEEQYINLNEAILKVYDSGFGMEDLKHTSTQILQYQQNNEFTIDTISSKPYDYKERTKVIDKATISGIGGNEFTILRLHDAIRNYNINTYDFVNELQSDFIKHHQFQLKPETFVHDTPLYDIQFKKNHSQFEVEGEIFISKGDFKIYKLEYSVFEKKVKYRFSPNDPWLASVEESKRGELLFKIIVEYRPKRDTMYPHYISFQNAFDILKPPKFKADSIGINNDYKRFEIVFNQELETTSAKQKNNYKLSYQLLPVEIDRLVVSKKKVLLYPKDAANVFDSKKVTERKKQTSKGVIVQISNVMDIDGNVIFEQEAETYRQYREFFVQELMWGVAKPKDSVLMIKNKPLFEKQPMAETQEISKYWMNTPLKNMRMK